MTTTGDFMDTNTGLPPDAAYEFDDAEFPGENGNSPPDSPGITPDYTASKPPKRARIPRVGTLREQFRSGGRRRQSDATSTGPSTRVPRRSVRPKSKVPHRRGQFVKPLTQFYTMVGMVTTSRDQVCGPAIVANAEACARSIDELAYENEWLRVFLWQITQTGMLAKVTLAHSPILFAVGMHHSTKFRFAIENSGMGEFIAGMLMEQAQAVRDSLAAEEGQNASDE